MAENEAKPKISQQDVQRYKELSSLISDFRKTLAPKKEAITKAIQENLPMKEMLEIMEFEGKVAASYNFEYGDRPYTMKVSLRKTT